MRLFTIEEREVIKSKNIKYDPEPEEDVVPETQEETSRKRKGNGKTKDAQTKAVPWKEDEHLALADAWCTTSKNKIKGNGCDIPIFQYQKKLFKSKLLKHDPV